MDQEEKTRIVDWLKDKDVVTVSCYYMQGHPTIVEIVSASELDLDKYELEDLEISDDSIDFTHQRLGYTIEPRAEDLTDAFGQSADVDDPPGAYWGVYTQFTDGDWDWFEANSLEFKFGDQFSDSEFTDFVSVSYPDRFSQIEVADGESHMLYMTYNPDLSIQQVQAIIDEFLAEQE